MHEHGERGIALIVTLMTMVLLMALGSALVLITSTETIVAANFHSGHEAFYAADAILERALADLRVSADWSAVLDRSTPSTFVDGAPSGTRTLTDGSSIDLAQLTNIANCRKTTACTDADTAATTAERPWGVNNPRWLPYAYGRLADSLGVSTVRSPFYVVAFVGDDSSENDGDPTRDGLSIGGLPNPGLGILSIRAEAFGPRQAHRVVEATIARMEPAGAAPGGGGITDLRVLSWREVN
jgi:Tfp pilus assembly protein PilX